MKTINIVEKDRVGLVMDISYILGKENINIEYISAMAVGDRGIISIVVKDFKKAEEVLKKNGFNVMSEDAILVKLKDTPGELSNVAKLLAEKNVNIKNIYVVSKGKGSSVVAILAENFQKAKKLLTEGGYCVEQHSEI